MHGRIVPSIDVKAFCSQWLEGLGVITLFRKERGNLWCELRPMLGQACVKDGWRAAGVGEARRAVIPAPCHPHTMLSFRRSSANSSSPCPLLSPKHRVTVMSVMGPKEKTKNWPILSPMHTSMRAGSKEVIAQEVCWKVKWAVSYLGYWLVYRLVRKAGWPDQRQQCVLHLEVLRHGGWAGGREGRESSFLFKASFLCQQTKD